MEKYRIFYGGKEYVFRCDSSVDYESLKDFLLDLLDVIPQITVINDSLQFMCHDMLDDHEELSSD